MSGAHALGSALAPYTIHTAGAASWTPPSASALRTKPPRMATHAHEAQISLLNDRIVILDRNLVDAFPANEVFRAVSDILALVRVGPRSSSANVWTPISNQ